MRILDYLWAGAGIIVALSVVGFALWQLGARRRFARGIAEPAGRRRRRFPTNDWAPTLFLLAVALVIAAGGYRMIRLHERDAREAAQRQLRAIADLSVSRIEQWFAERGADAEAIATNPYVATAMRRILAAPEGSPAADREFRQWLNSLKESHRYEDIFLIDSEGSVRASANPNARPPSSRTLEQVRQAMQTRSTSAVGFRLGTPGDRTSARFGMVAPLIAGLAESEPVAAALLFRIDPDRFLIPTIERWPIESATGETLLATVEGGDITYLSWRRHSALQEAPRYPADMKSRIAAMVARGSQGTLEGVDYRDVPVLGAGREVHGTPWFVVAKIDVDEVYAPIRGEVMYLVVMTVLLIFGATLLTGAWWRGQQLRFAAAQREARLREQALLRHFEYLSRFANDMVLLTDETGTIVEANDRAMAAYGYPREELIGLPMGRLRDEDSEIHFCEDGESIDGVVYEAMHRRKDGSVLPVEVSIRALDVQGRNFAQAIIRDITARKQAEARLAQLAQYDTLTGLPNRNLFRDRLDLAIARARRAGASLALMFLDLDQFKDVNDKLGHAAGDALLRAVGERLRESLREMDTIARLGGDEFTVLVESVPDRALAEAVARKIVSLFEQPVTVGGQDMSITCSVGITVYPDDAQDADDLLRAADNAMYRAKHEGRNTYRFYATPR